MPPVSYYLPAEIDGIPVRHPYRGGSAPGVGHTRSMFEFREDHYDDGCSCEIPEFDTVGYPHFASRPYTVDDERRWLSGAHDVDLDAWAD